MSSLQSCAIEPARKAKIMKKMMTNLFPLASSRKTSGRIRNVASRKKRNPAISRPTDSPDIDNIPIPKPNRSSMKPMMIVRKVSFNHIPESLNSAISMPVDATSSYYASERSASLLILCVGPQTSFLYIGNGGQQVSGLCLTAPTTTHRPATGSG